MEKNKIKRKLSLFMAIIILISNMQLTAFANQNSILENQTTSITSNLDENTATKTNFMKSLGGLVGEGTIDNPILISSAYDLHTISSNIKDKLKINDIFYAEAYYELIQDIDLSNEPFEPIGTYSTPFMGKLDGKGHTIKNLYISKEDLEYVGLFGYIKNADIKNLKLENVDVLGKNYVGALVGYAGNSNILKCAVTGTGEIIATSTVNRVGGVIGSVSYSMIEEIFSTIQVKGSISSTNNYTGGLIGVIQHSTLRNSYKLGKVDSGRTPAGGIVGLASTGAIIENTYFGGTIRGNSFGMLAGSGASNIKNSYYDKTINHVIAIEESGKTTEEMNQQETFVGWDFENVWGFKEDLKTPYLKNADYEMSFNIGTIQNPYKIYSKEDFLKIKDDLNGFYELEQDIDLENEPFEPIGTYSTPFMGKLDGKGHTIKNLYISKEDLEYVGLFGYITNADIKNLKLENINVTGKNFAGALVGYAGNSNILKCAVTGTGEIIATSTVNRVGGVIGSVSYSMIEEIFSTVQVKGSISSTNNYTGGLIGVIQHSTLRNSYKLGKVDSGRTPAGGIVGLASTGAIIENTYFGGTIRGNSFGMLAGSGASNIKNSYYDKTINHVIAIEESGKTTEEMNQQETFVGWDFENVWGFREDLKTPYLKNVDYEMSFNIGTIQNPYKIYSKEDFLKIKDDLNGFYELEQDIDLENEPFEPIGTYSTPFMGKLDGKGHTIKNLYISKETLDYVGLFGYITNADIKNLKLENVNVFGGSDVGSLVGYAKNSNILRCSVTGSGEVKSMKYRAGGLIGAILNDSLAEEVFSTIRVTGAISRTGSHTGGLVGIVQNSTLRNAYSLGNVGTSGTYAGGIVGLSNTGAKIENTYFGGTISGKYIGMLTGSGVTSFTSSYYDKSINNVTTNEVAGKTTEEMKQQKTFLSWDFENVWKIKEGVTYPELIEHIVESENGGEVEKPDEFLTYTFSEEGYTGNVIPSAIINKTKNNVSNLEIVKIENHSYLNENLAGYLGNAFEFTVTGDFDKAEVTFEYADKDRFADENFAPRIYYFNEETEELEEVENQTVIDNKISATLSHFSKYTILDKTKYDESLVPPVMAVLINHYVGTKGNTSLLDSLLAMVDTSRDNTRIIIYKLGYEGTELLFDEIVNKSNRQSLKSKISSLNLSQSFMPFTEKINVSIEEVTFKLSRVASKTNNRHLTFISTDKNGFNYLDDGYTQSSIINRLKNDNIVFNAINASNDSISNTQVYGLSSTTKGKVLNLGASNSFTNITTEVKKLIDALYNVETDLPNNTYPLAWPTNSGEITLWYGDVDEAYKVKHEGIDIQSRDKNDIVVKSISDGKILNIEKNTVFGDILYVNFLYDNKNMQVRYAHLENIPDFKIGDKISKGDFIGNMMHQEIQGLEKYEGTEYYETINKGANLVEIIIYESTNGAPCEFSLSNKKSIEPMNLLVRPEFSSDYLLNPMATSVNTLPQMRSFATMTLMMNEDNQRYEHNMDLIDGEVYLRKAILELVREYDSTITHQDIIDKNILIYDDISKIATINFNEKSLEYGSSLFNAHIKNNRMIVNQDFFKHFFNDSDININSNIISGVTYEEHKIRPVENQGNMNIYANIEHIDLNDGQLSLNGYLMLKNNKKEYFSLSGIVYNDIDEFYTGPNVLAIDFKDTSNRYTIITATIEKEAIENMLIESNIDKLKTNNLTILKIGFYDNSTKEILYFEDSIHSFITYDDIFLISKSLTELNSEEYFRINRSASWFLDFLEPIEGVIVGEPANDESIINKNSTQNFARKKEPLKPKEFIKIEPGMNMYYNGIPVVNFIKPVGNQFWEKQNKITVSEIDKNSKFQYVLTQYGYPHFSKKNATEGTVFTDYLVIGFSDSVPTNQVSIDKSTGASSAAEVVVAIKIVNKGRTKYVPKDGGIYAYEGSSKELGEMDKNKIQNFYDFYLENINIDIQFNQLSEIISKYVMVSNGGEIIPGKTEVDAISIIRVFSDVIGKSNVGLTIDFINAFSEKKAEYRVEDNKVQADELTTLYETHNDSVEKNLPSKHFLYGLNIGDVENAIYKEKDHIFYVEFEFLVPKDFYKDPYYNEILAFKDNYKSYDITISYDICYLNTYRSDRVGKFNDIRKTEKKGVKKEIPRRFYKILVK